MGGPGSGEWYRWDRVPTVEDYNSIDVRCWQREGLLEFGRRFRWVWLVDGEETGSVSVEVKRSSVVLDYRHSSNDKPWQEVRESIYLDYTSCNYGGWRTWFRCPCCNRRVALLYLAGPHFLCRHCYRLPYPSQGDGREERLRRVARKIRKRLGASMDLTDDYLPRPKGMHRATFKRLVNKEESATGELFAANRHV